MPEKHESQRLRDQQALRERTEQELAEEAPGPTERAEHERRSEQADYLREKLDEQVSSPDRPRQQDS